MNVNLPYKCYLGGFDKYKVFYRLKAGTNKIIEIKLAIVFNLVFTIVFTVVFTIVFNIVNNIVNNSIIQPCTQVCRYKCKQMSRIPTQTRTGHRVLTLGCPEWDG